MLKVVHIHTDLKFVGGTDRFEKSHFDNAVIIIGASETYNGPCSDRAIFLSSSKSDLRHAVTICSNADLVIFYALDIVKSYIATMLPESITVAWRFFGHELYGRNIKDYLSEYSLAFYRTDGVVRRLKRSLVQFKYKVTYGSSIDTLFERAIERQDLFLCLSKDEYDHLVIYWKNLPLFVQLPIPMPLAHRDIHKKDNTIIIGNSRSIFNNHIDIINLIEMSNCDDKLSFLIPFSYVPESEYSTEVKSRVKASSSNIHLLEDFLPRENYFDRITTAKAAVINSYRQMAMGNIFAFLRYGVKVYLNSRNVMYDWLTDFGLRVYTIEDFASDLISASKLELSSEEKQINMTIMQQLQSEFGGEKFTNHIITFVEDRRRTALGRNG